MLFDEQRGAGLTSGALPSDEQLRAMTRNKLMELMKAPLTLGHERLMQLMKAGQGEGSTPS